jgi:hypothetical protein
MLQTGWEQPGEAGREACRAAVGAAEPVGDVEVSQLSEEGSSAELRISYTVDGEARTDVVHLLRSGPDWLIDAVARAAAAS